MATVVRMPSVMANASEGAIQSWLTEEGQTVSVGDPLVEIETEKAVVEYAAEVPGTIGKLLAQAGDNLVVGTPIAVILEAGEGQDQVAGPGGSRVWHREKTAPRRRRRWRRSRAPASVEAEPGTQASGGSPAQGPKTPGGSITSPSAPAQADSGATSAPVQQSGSTRLFASPIVRRLAHERGIDIATLTGTGPNGRIVRRDLDAVDSTGSSVASAGSADVPSVEAAGSAGSAPVGSAGSAPVGSAGSAPAGSAVPSSSPAAGTEYVDVPLTGMRKAIARRLTESKTTVPHFYVTAHIRVDALFELRKSVNEAAPRKISVNDFVIKAVAAALVDVPAANSIWGGDHIRRFTGVDIAVAVAVEGGLLTPVLRDVQSLSLSRVSQTIADLAERARAGRLRQDELEGGTFSISNLGMYGVDEFSAILNPPQSGILAVSAAKQRSVVSDGELTVATVMTVTLSADHRVIDGAVAAEWMAALTRRLENPLTILI